MTSSKVVLHVTLAMSKPNTISISNSQSSSSLKLIATLHQLSSPFPDRSVTVLTTRTFLDWDDDLAFRKQYMASPVSVEDPSREIWMYSKGWRIHWADPPSGDPDMRVRDDLTFITIPPVGEGVQIVVFDFPPEKLFYRYKNPATMEEKLSEFKPGERFEIKVANEWMGWWTWGSLDTDLRTKKFARWSFPAELPLDRAPLDDESEEMRCRLEDPVDWHDVNHLTSVSAVEDEETPNIKQMKLAGWVFGEPVDSLEVIADNAAVFEFIA